MKQVYIMLAITAAVLMGTGCTDPQAAQSSTMSDPAAMEDPFDPDRPPTAKTLYLMADILVAQGKDAEAEQLYRRIQTQYPDFMPTYNDYAAVLMRQRRIPEATKILETGLKLNPNDPVLLNNMGMCFLIRKDYPRSLNFFTDAAAIVPENTRYRSNMATVLALMGRYDEALSLYRQILPENQARENVRLLRENINMIE